MVSSIQSARPNGEHIGMKPWLGKYFQVEGGGTVVGIAGQLTESNLAQGEEGNEHETKLPARLICLVI